MNSLEKILETILDYWGGEVKYDEDNKVICIAIDDDYGRQEFDIIWNTTKDKVLEIRDWQKCIYEDKESEVD